MSTQMIAAPAPGVFWQRPGPDAEPFLSPGQEVRIGQTIGIIEIMKMFVEVHADRDGIVKRYVIDNGQSIPMGASLVELEGA
ncbi:acetyl-CoA carboxylase [Glaciibacter superstes]|uniref:acetyl-CoA carboxylase n=1 Tax=Glaciibacter superstes TaxID=501023 RepID=UPI0003B674B0|nr:acetyl-CoA carboxylase [Glaciibacter superstes]